MLFNSSMSKYFIISILLAILSLGCFPAPAQNHHGMVASGEYLPGKYQKKMKQGASLLRKGDKFFEKAEAVQRKIELLEESGKSGQLKATRLQERRQRLQRAAGTYIEDAHRRQFRVLRRALKNEFFAAYQQIKDSANQKFKEAAVIRRKAENLSFRNNSAELHQKAADIEMEALELLLTRIQNLSVILEDTSPDRMGELFKAPRDTLPGVKDAALQESSIETDTLIVDVGSVAEGQAESGKLGIETIESVESSEEPVDIEQTVKGEPDVFFSIQILASRVPLTDKAIKAAYNGKLPVFDAKSDGWYRYSAGRFTTLNAAKEAMSRETIKGFIVAYRKDKRITIKEALKYLENMIH